LCNLRSKADPDDEQARLLAEVTTKQSKLFARYQCSHCGFLAHTFSWQCPGCERWDSFPPIRVDEAKKASYH
jgi:lipopolysaccharide biosynthesis regulator YciM